MQSLDETSTSHKEKICYIATILLTMLFYFSFWYRISNSLDDFKLWHKASERYSNMKSTWIKKKIDVFKLDETPGKYLLKFYKTFRSFWCTGTVFCSKSWWKNNENKIFERWNLNSWISVVTFFLIWVIFAGVHILIHI